jgi:hypothetical protein
LKLADEHARVAIMATELRNPESALAGIKLARSGLCVLTNRIALGVDEYLNRRCGGGGGEAGGEGGEAGKGGDAAAWSELYKRECVLSVSPAVVLQRAAWKGTEVRRVAVEKGVWNKWNWREVTKEVRTLLTDLVYF